MDIEFAGRAIGYDSRCQIDTALGGLGGRLTVRIGGVVETLALHKLNQCFGLHDHEESSRA